MAKLYKVEATNLKTGAFRTAEFAYYLEASRQLKEWKKDGFYGVIKTHPQKTIRTQADLSVAMDDYRSDQLADSV